MVYHEQQRLMRCAQHTINGLLQEPAFDAAALTEIALNLDAGGKLSLAHRWPVLGNYDINVLVLALQQRGYEVRWWDRRKSIEQLRSSAELDTSLGLVLNERRALLGFIPSRHWLAVRRVDGVWYDLDSRLRAPVMLTPEALFERLQQHMSEQGGQVLVVERIGSTALEAPMEGADAAAPVEGSHAADTR